MADEMLRKPKDPSDATRPGRMTGPAVPPTVSMPQRTHPVAYVLTAGLLVGTFDLVFAMTYWGWKADLPAMRILQSVAAGLLGEASYAGGTSTAMFGLGLHFGIALVMAVVYYLAARRFPALWKHPIDAGAAYGVVLYVAMNWIVVPLSAASAGSREASWIVASLVVHILLIGVPIALFVRIGILQDGGFAQDEGILEDDRLPQ